MPRSAPVTVDRLDRLVGPVAVAAHERVAAHQHLAVSGQAHLDARMGLAVEQRPVHTGTGRLPTDRAEVAAAVERANARLSRVEQVKRHLLLDTD